MNRIKILLVVIGVTYWLGLGYATTKLGASFFTYFSGESKIDTPSEGRNSSVQVAILLDTSGSMEGLIEQAKSQLWNILNELSRTRKNDEDTNLEIALYEYGNPEKTSNSNQVNKLTGFTTDMDLVSEKLFALSTDGGDEYCGTVIQSSLNELEWRDDLGLKLIYIAGNEEFTQGMISFETACKNAKENGVVVNTIYCGDYSLGIRDHWDKGAQAGGGSYLNINQNEETVYISSPYDDKINKLNSELNKTYIPYGDVGKEKMQSQKLQDVNSFSISVTNAADRAVFKSSKAYSNKNWDLVDAYKKDKKVLKNAKPISDTLQNISLEELESRIQSVSERRDEIQSEIQELDKKRRQYKIENASVNDDKSLQQNMIKSIQKQAKKKGYKVKE